MRPFEPGDWARVNILTCSDPLYERQPVHRRVGITLTEDSVKPSTDGRWVSRYFLDEEALISMLGSGNTQSYPHYE